MKTRRILSLITLLPILGMVTACNGENSISPEHQRKFRDLPEVNTLNEVTTKGEKQAPACPSTGNSRVFVVPIEFKDYPADEIGKYYNSELTGPSSKRYARRFTDERMGTGRGAEAAREDIRKVYFGESSDTQWESLSSFYKKSSYGALNLNGIVAPWYKPYWDWEHPTTTWATAKQWVDAYGEYAASRLAAELIEYYSDDVAKHYLDLKKEDGSDFTSGKDFLQYFDSNHDGAFDLIEVVYSAPFYATDAGNAVYDKPINNDIFWAYCGGNSTGTENVERPTISKYAFFSYYTFVEGGYFDEAKQTHRNWTCQEVSEGVPMDAHTLIHETGHGLGLKDYYDTSYSGKNPCGSVDMMDHNVGDHCAYSKSLYGWVNPTVVTGPTEVTIKSFTETGDCIMVPYRGFYKDHEQYGNSFYTEYLMLELYTPTGLNEADSKHNYAGNYPLCPSIPGVKIYHVDSRLGTFQYNGGWQFIDYTEKIVGTGDYGKVDTATTNTETERVDESWLLQFLPRSSETIISMVNNDNLFQAGDGFNNGENYADFMMNEKKGEERDQEIHFGYKITIKAASAESATIEFAYAD